MLMAKFQMLYCPFVPFRFCVQFSDFGSAWCASVDEVEWERYVSMYGDLWNWIWQCGDWPPISLIFTVSNTISLDLVHTDGYWLVTFSQSGLHSTLPLNVLTTFSYTYTLPRKFLTPFRTLQQHFHGNDHTAFSYPPTALQLPQLPSLLSLILLHYMSTDSSPSFYS